MYKLSDYKLIIPNCFKLITVETYGKYLNNSYK